MANLLPGSCRGDLWAKAEDLRVALLEAANWHARDLATELAARCVG